MLQFTIGKLSVGFDSVHGGLPAFVSAAEGDGRVTEIFGPHDWKLEVELENGHVLHPVAILENAYDYREDDCTHVVFPNMHFADENGTQYLQHYLTLQHELYDDGTAFTNMFFFVRDIHTSGIVRFDIAASPRFDDFDDLKWHFRERPNIVDGTLVTAQCQRFLDPGSNHAFDSILPYAGFYATRHFAPSLYAEVFMEGVSSLSGEPQDTATSIHWNGNSPSITWSLQTRPFPQPLVNQLRNQWGWVIRPAQTERHLPPFRMYHYFDNYMRYPTEEIVRAVADTGCDVMVMHENWRSDTQNDGIPLEVDSFVRMRDALHANNIRLAVYIRGVEESVVMRQVGWFKHLLTPNFDGLYMDYGSPFGHMSQPTELYCGGRILFRQFYRAMMALRQVIGPDAVFFSHTGPSFSALTMSFMTGYVSGEGERGLLIRGRREHEYFSMAAVCPGTLWSAAFPEYASPEIIPFLAATGQYPHASLGRQFLTSSLDHPSVPGINDRAFVPLWKIWSVMKREKDIAIVNDFNSSGVFPKDPDAGHYLMMSRQRSIALLVLANFNQNDRSLDCRADWSRCGFIPQDCSIRVLSGGEVTLVGELPEGLSVPGFGVAAILLTRSEINATALLDDFNRPEPPLSPLGLAYLKKVEEQRQLRTVPASWPETYLKITLPELSPTPYEDSMNLDLFNNAFQLGKISHDGTFVPVCWIDRNGISSVRDDSRNLFAGLSSPPVRLNDILSPGVHKLALYSTHDGQPFYSFCYVDLSPEPQFGSQRRRIEFLNDLESDRAYIHFICRL